MFKCFLTQNYKIAIKYFFCIGDRQCSKTNLN